MVGQEKVYETLAALGIEFEYTEHHVYVFLDKHLQEAKRLSFHPNDNHASLAIKTEDFIRYMDYVGNAYEWIELY